MSCMLGRRHGQVNTQLRWACATEKPESGTPAERVARTSAFEVRGSYPVVTVARSIRALPRVSAGWRIRPAFFAGMYLSR
jgi:hypothetical protein